MMMAAVMGACRHIAGMRTTYEESRTVADNAATADVHLAQEQIGEHAKQREHANDHHPCDSGSRVAMGPKQDPRDDSQLEQRDECDSEQRVVERRPRPERSIGSKAILRRPTNEASAGRGE